jgi:hypothetical protein
MMRASSTRCHGVVSRLRRLPTTHNLKTSTSRREVTSSTGGMRQHTPRVIHTLELSSMCPLAPIRGCRAHTQIGWPVYGTRNNRKFSSGKNGNDILERQRWVQSRQKQVTLRRRNANNNHHLKTKKRMSPTNTMKGPSSMASMSNKLGSKEAVAMDAKEASIQASSPLEATSQPRLLEFRHPAMAMKRLSILATKRQELLEGNIKTSANRASLIDILRVAAHVMESLRHSISNGTCDLGTHSRDTNNGLATIYNQALTLYSNPARQYSYFADSHPDNNNTPRSTTFSRFDEAVKVIGDLYDARLDVTTDHFSTVLRIAAAEHRWDDAAALFTAMLDSDAGMTPLSITDGLEDSNSSSEKNHAVDGCSSPVRIGLYAMARSGEAQGNNEAVLQELQRAVEKLSMVSARDGEACK